MVWRHSRWRSTPSRHDGARDQDLREERRVEGEHQAAAAPRGTPHRSPGGRSGTSCRSPASPSRQTQSPDVRDRAGVDRCSAASSSHAFLGNTIDEELREALDLVAEAAPDASVLLERSLERVDLVRRREVDVTSRGTSACAGSGGRRRRLPRSVVGRSRPRRSPRPSSVADPRHGSVRIEEAVAQPLQLRRSPRPLPSGRGGAFEPRRDEFVLDGMRDVGT